MIDTEKIQLLSQIGADAFEWIGSDATEGYWKGVAYSMMSVVEFLGDNNDA